MKAVKSVSAIFSVLLSLLFSYAHAENSFKEKSEIQIAVKNFTLDIEKVDHGYVTSYGTKYMWSKSEKTFVPNFVMLGTNGGIDLSTVTQATLDGFLDEMFDLNGFNGVHVPVFGQWFHIGNDKVSASDNTLDQATFDKLKMIIEKVYSRGGVVHIWAWGDHSRSMTPRSLPGGIMGSEEKMVWDKVYTELNPLKGWTIGYGFDLHEWVNGSQLRSWYTYCHDKPDWRHLMGARAQKKQINQIYDGLDYNGYENHKPRYEIYRAILDHAVSKPAFSEDRFRVRGGNRSKDPTLNESRLMIWEATMAGGVAGIWGYLDNEEGVSRSYPNADQMLCYSKFWKNRFLKDMECDNSGTDGYCLRNGTSNYVYYKKNTSSLTYTIAGGSKRVIAVDTQKAYAEIRSGVIDNGVHTYNAPYVSDWALAVGSFEGDTPDLSFKDITDSAGTGGPTGNGETGGHGVMFADIDNDGDSDIYITMNWSDPMPDLFFLNQGSNTFLNNGLNRNMVQNTDVGVHGMCFADLDNDGDYDMVKGHTSADTGPASNQILKNNGNGHFSDATSDIVSSRKEYTRGVVTFDMDNDGDLDIFCVSGYLGTGDPVNEKNELYRNQGGLVFETVTENEAYDALAGQGVTDTDFDGDGDIDLIAANRTGDVNILENNGSGSFTVIDPESIGITTRAKDGISTADIDHDGDLDILLSGDNYADLYKNDNNISFTLTQHFSVTNGYMGAFGDLDNDTDPDVIFAGDDVVYLNDGEGNFTPGPSLNISDIDDPRAISFSDIDNDGDLDFALGCKRSRNHLFRNDLNSGNWIKLKLFSPNGQAGAFGTKIELYPVGHIDKTQLIAMQEANSNSGYLAQKDPIIHFGLGNLNHVDIVVRFPCGFTRTISNAAANQTIIVDGTEKDYDYDAIDKGTWTDSLMEET
ncbi:MAG: CRTAC1 family protein [Desulfobacteraceae bacterium]|nr:CRTAC1 family protein [Desulfobacteraceae bacterium]